MSAKQPTFYLQQNIYCKFEGSENFDIFFNPPIRQLVFCIESTMF